MLSGANQEPKANFSSKAAIVKGLVDLTLDGYGDSYHAEGRNQGLVKDERGKDSCLIDDYSS